MSPPVVRPATLLRAATLGALLLTTACRTAGSPTTATTAPTAPAPASANVVNEDPQARRARWLDMFARSYFPGRSGQVFYVPHQGDFLVDKDPLYQFMHGSPWDYDTHIPLVFHGAPFVRPGRFTEAVSQQDVAPTLAALLGATPPATTTGRALASAIAPQTRRPRILSLFVLDGMRADYFSSHADVLPMLTRLTREGAVFTNARVSTIPTSTSAGHATIGTGTDPRIHGQVVNRLFNRLTGTAQDAYNGLDPGELMALTLADVWNIATDGRARIVGQGGAIRATAGLVGHGACIINGRKTWAASYSTRDAGWETNPQCYEMASVLGAINGQRYWSELGGTWLGHDISTPTRFRPSAPFQKFEGDALAAVLEAIDIGQDDVTDLVLVNIKGPDYVSHAYGPASREVRDTLAELDRQLTRALAIIDRKAGPGGSVVAITADHGMPGDPPAGRRRIQIREIVEALEKRFSPTPPTIIQAFTDPANSQIHLDTARMAALGVSPKDVALFLEAQFFAASFTEDEVRAAQTRLPLGK